VTSEIQQNRYDRLIRRVAGIIGPGSKVSEVLTELFPMIDVENVPSELLILAGTDSCFGGGTITGAAGEAGKAGVFNPAGSNTILTVTQVVVATVGSTDTLRWGINTNELGTRIATERFTDTRKPLTQLPVGKVGSESAVALANATGQTRVLANSNFRLLGKNDLVQLSPGFGFEVGRATVATTMIFVFYWRERPMESSEVLIRG